jgi:nucleotide-binding universal stress UspA family protein
MTQISSFQTATDDLAPKSSGRQEFRHLIVVTDLSLNSERVVDFAVQLAKRFQAKLTLLHVIVEPSALEYSMEDVPMKEIHGWEEEADERLVKQLWRVQREYQNVRSVQFYAPHPDAQIARVDTGLKADLLVISRNRYWRWKHLLFASGAATILRNTSCPVLVVPSKCLGERTD